MALSEKEKNVLTAGLILAGMLVVIFVYLHLMFFKAQIEANDKKISTSRGEIRKMETEYATMTNFLRNRREVEAMRHQLTVAMRKLPSEPQAVEFLQELRASLERTGMAQNRVTPKNPTPRALYTEIPYEVQGSARYHEFGQFLNLIECNPRRFMRVNSFDVRNSNDRPTIHPITVGISTFMFNRRR